VSRPRLERDPLTAMTTRTTIALVMSLSLLRCERKPETHSTVEQLTPPASREQTDTSALESYVTSVYAPIDASDPGRAGMPVNRFLAAGPVQIMDLWPRDSTCQVYLSYTDGLFCVTAQYGVPFAVRPFDRSPDRDHERAQRLAQTSTRNAIWIGGEISVLY